MNLMKWTIHPFWDARVMDAKTKLSRVLLTINLNGKQFRVSIKVRCTQAEFKSAMTTRNAAVKELRKSINDYVLKAESILERMAVPDKEMFMKLFKSDIGFSYDNTQMYPVYELRKSELDVEKRFGTKHSLKAMFHALIRYKLSLKGMTVKDDAKVVDIAPTVDLSFEEVDNAFLKSFKSYLLDTGRSETTAGIYLGHFRAFYNYAMDNNIIPHKDEKSHPFHKIKISNAVRSKSVLYAEQIKQLWEYKPNGIREERAKAYWFCCYLMNGMNFKDLAYLRWRNVKGDILTFVRHKTKHTTSSMKEIKLHLHDEVLKIIVEHGNKSKNPDDFIFPLLHGCKDLRHMEDTKNRHARVFNKKLNKIGKSLGFDIRLNLNIARHSFATMLKVNGTPTAFISDAMGHTSVNTTAHYLKSLPNEQLKEISNVLMKF